MPPQQNPGAPAAIAAGVAMITVPALVATPLLAAVGFGAGGIVAGSAAAGIQSGIGSVAAGSLFAVLQSAGAGGYGLAAVHGVVQAVGAVVGAGGIGAFFRGRGDGDNDPGSQDGNGDNNGDENNDDEEGSEKEKGGDDEQEGKLILSH
ncbi:hypothetical protein IL306_000386 [Fusarium sp. DS 682]|nr:hypothetical protein IL306_000386 [Fusarium sp. DS 682]